MTERLTWDEIRARYPHQSVGLTDREPDSINFDTARVKYTEKEIGYDELVEKTSDGEVHMMYTSPEDVIHVPTPFSIRFPDGTVI